MPIRFYPPHLHPLPPKGGEEFLKSALSIDFGVIWIIIYPLFSCIFFNAFYRYLFLLVGTSLTVGSAKDLTPFCTLISFSHSDLSCSRRDTL
jgi:hypothetical protein